jgi:hypothetical protein
LSEKLISFSDNFTASPKKPGRMIALDGCDSRRCGQFMATQERPASSPEEKSFHDTPACAIITAALFVLGLLMMICGQLN